MSEHDPVPISDPSRASDTAPVEPEVSPAPAAPEIEGRPSATRIARAGNGTRAELRK